MRNKVEIDGKWYELVPLEEVEKKESSPDPVFYYGCDSECGNFSFNILLNDDDDYNDKNARVSDAYDELNNNYVMPASSKYH